MGVGGKFWELLKPYARLEGFDFLRDKKVAIDLSFWIVQHETAIKNRARNPHLRLTFFRTINLFSKFGAFPVFVLDGTPSPLKSQARIARFFRFSGIDTSTSTGVEEGVSKERNLAFSRCVDDCVELLELLGMPVLKANGEAEALCAQLNKDGHVDACITADSDAFLFGATCVIKCLRPNSKEPFECYNMSDIEAGLGLKRKHLIAISLLVGNDHDLNGVQGIGLDKALRFVQRFSEDEILNRLYEIGKGDVLLFQDGVRYVDDVMPCSDESSPKPRQSHCSFCGHPGSKTAHFKFSCEYCVTANSVGCLKKSQRFQCNCLSCDKVRKEKDQKKHENWWIKVCNMITMEPNFPNDEIIEMYVGNNHGMFTEDGSLLAWGDPKTELVVDFLAYHQSWQRSFVRQRILPMLSTMYLREMARNPNKTLLVGQYEFHSIQRVKIRYGHQSYVVKWKKAISGELSCAVPVERSNMQEEECTEVDDEPVDMLDESIDPQIHVDGCWILTDESPALVCLAFPEEVVKFIQEKELKEIKRRKTSMIKSEGSSEMSELSKPQGVQLSITEFYRSTKIQSQAKPGEDLAKLSYNPGDGSSKQKRKVLSPNLSKAVRRRLLFGVTVLLVDGDSTCLTIVSKMLRRLGYEVMTAKRATEAFCIIQERQYEIDLILAEGCLPDMDKYELLETMRKISKLPVVLMSIDYNGKAVLGSLFKGAVLYLVKPITMDDLKNLWQFAFIKERKNVVAAEEIFGFEEGLSMENASDVTVECQPLISEGRQNYQNEKRERSDDRENNEEDNDHSAALKKPRLIWTDELHNRFLEAIKVLGIDGAHPKKILQHMNVPGLKKENVSSHLQKYRLSLKREQYAIQKTMSRGSTVAHVVSHHLLSPFSPQEGLVKFENWRSMAVADQPDTNGLIQENLNGRMPIPSLSSAYLLKHADSNCNDESTIKFEQQTPCNKQLDSAHSEFNLTGDRVIVNDGLVGFHQIGNLEQFLKGETDLLNIGDSGLESLLHCPTPFDGSLQEKQQKQLKFLLPEPSQLPRPPQEQEEHDVFGAEEGREFNEVFTMGKRQSRLSYDEDSDDFW